MENLPEATLAKLAIELMREKAAAWMRLDGQGLVESAGGDWKRFGQEPPIAGQAGVDAFVALEGLLPTGRVLSLHSLDLSPRCAADLHVVPDGACASIFLLDCTPRTEEWRRIQQKGNELDLLQAELAKQTLALGISGSIYGGSDRGLFQWHDNDGLVLCSPVQDWMHPFLQGRGGEPRLAPQDPSSFLGNFLVDAQEFWAGTAPGHLESGPWTEVHGENPAAGFEVTALLDSTGAKGLVLRRQSDSTSVEPSLLQGVRESELNLQAAHAEAQKKEVLLQCIVHDLRGPLSSMSAVLSILDQDGLAADKRSKLLEVARRQARRQDEMMREVLSVFASEIRDLQRVERSPERAPDLVQVARSTVRDRIPAFEQAARTLEVHTPDSGSHLVPGHAGRLARVIGNLIDNGRRFTPQGTSVEVRVERQGVGGDLELHVLDRGPGVPEQDRDRLFQRFSQVAGTETPGGPESGSVGLGLFFCRTSVEAWGGSIGYAERPGGGADFWIRLPALSPGQ